MKHVGTLALLACASGAAMTALTACSGSDDSRTSFAASDDASTDAPKASQPVDPDSGVIDAGPAPRPPFDASDVPVACAQTPCAVELVAGNAHFCARMQDGSVRCWGDNAFGALGGGDAVENGGGIAPIAVAGVATATQISASAHTTCARLADGSVKCWGSNEDGQLGLQETSALVDFDPHPTPALVALSVPVARVDVGERSACALGPTNTLVCWGANDKKQLARPRTGDTDGASALGVGASDLRGNTVLRTGEGRDSTFGMSSSGQLLGWGVIWGREASISPDPVPFALPSLTKVTGFAVGSTHACTIADGTIHCWGESRRGALGTGLPDIEKLPVGVRISSARVDVYPQQLAVSTDNTCARLTDGTVECCGDDTKGQLGQVGRDVAAGPVPHFEKATAFTGYAVAVATSSTTTCVLRREGIVECWGGNGAGELGQGSNDEDRHPSPVTVTFP